MQSGPPMRDAERLAWRLLGRDRMVQPLVVRLVDIVLGAERALVERPLGALVDDRALVAREGHAVLVVLEEVLAHLRPDLLEQEAQVGGDGVVAQDCVPRLEQVAQAEQGEEAEEDKRNGE